MFCRRLVNSLEGVSQMAGEFDLTSLNKLRLLCFETVLQWLSVKLCIISNLIVLAISQIISNLYHHYMITYMITCLIHITIVVVVAGRGVC